MEKRGFSFRRKETEISNVIVGAILILIVICWFRHRENDWSAYIPAMALAAGIAWTCLQQYMWSRSQSLEISDQGLRETGWPKRVFRLDWNQINSVEIARKPRYLRGYDYIEILNSAKRGIRIPGTPGDNAEIMNILRQRLPEGMFLER